PGPDLQPPAAPGVPGRAPLNDRGRCRPGRHVRPGQQLPDAAANPAAAAGAPGAFVPDRGGEGMSENYAVTRQASRFGLELRHYTGGIYRVVHGTEVIHAGENRAIA